MDDAPLFFDVSLARRLELAEGHSTARAVEARASLDPDSGAAWIEVAGALAMYDGITSPLTQTFGLGLFGAPSDPDMDAVERFFRDRSAPVFHEISPLAGAEMLALLNRRGYQPFECTNVLVRSISGDRGAPPERRVRVRLLAGDDGGSGPTRPREAGARTRTSRPTCATSAPSPLDGRAPTASWPNSTECPWQRPSSASATMSPC